MTQNKIIFDETIKLGSEYPSRERVRIVSSDTAKFRDVKLIYEVYSGSDAMNNEQWRRASMEKETRILNHLGMLYIKQLQDQTFGGKNV